MKSILIHTVSAGVCAFMVTAGLLMYIWRFGMVDGTVQRLILTATCLIPEVICGYLTVIHTKAAIEEAKRLF